MKINWLNIEHVPVVILVDLGSVGYNTDCCTWGVFDVDRIMSSWKVRNCRVPLLLALLLEEHVSTEVDEVVLVATLKEAFGPLSFFTLGTEGDATAVSWDELGVTS